MTNEFEQEFTPEPGTPEALELATIQDTPAPEVDDLDSEPTIDEVPPAPPVQQPAAVVTPTPAPAAAGFDQRAPISGLVDTDVNSLEGLALETKRKLSLEPKVTMMIPLDQGEKPGAYRSVLINGYRFDVRKNTMVALPQSVAQLLMDAYRITNDVLENNELNLSHAGDEKRRALGMN